MTGSEVLFRNIAVHHVDSCMGRKGRWGNNTGDMTMAVRFRMEKGSETWRNLVDRLSRS